MGTIAATQEYIDLVQNAQNEAIGQELRNRATRCVESLQNPLSLPSDPSFLDSLMNIFRWPQELWKSTTNQRQIELPPLHPTAQLIQNQMLALPPFSSMTSETLSRSTIGIVIPSWLAGSELACHVAAAAERTFNRLAAFESPPSSAHAAAGYELCHISYDAFDCTGPGQIMTLEYDGSTAVASLMQTPLPSWSANPVTFSTRRGLASQAMTGWIDEFLQTERPERLILAGSRTTNVFFADALVKSRAVSILEKSRGSLPPEDVLVLGAAQAAKESLERQVDDCGEPKECVELRREADRIAGAYRALEPAAWPISGPRHVELWCVLNV